ncbi:unnamed protein product [Owenia fusiformis]|uniref:GT23 domain-containing protein n=1 Tax=Owenia fusiformis TaxID=6347 RepID=A0A8S4P928_OWEFU|nr:unnamed protein product [Owenia fusiformis]
MRGMSRILIQVFLLFLIGLSILYSYTWIWGNHSLTMKSSYTTPLSQMQNYKTSQRRKQNGSQKTWNQFGSHRNIGDPSVHQYQGKCAKESSELFQLSFRLFQSIEAIMNPVDCSKAKYLLCEWPFKDWGLGSMMHQISYCFSVALATNRVLLIRAQEKFIPQSWDYYLLHPSIKCWDYQYTNYTFWYDLENFEKSNVQVVRLLLTTSRAASQNKTWPRPLPENLMKSSALWYKLAQLHQSRALWVVGQLMGYLIQPSLSFSQQLKDLKRAIGFIHPIIGVHIRRGDKITEAEPIPTYKYIERIEAYINQLDYKTSNDKVPSIFIASDDRKLIDQIKQHYTQYNIIHVPHYFFKTHLDLIMFDILLLKECDYFIGTFSSNVGRLVYELQQSMYADASCLAESLDDSYTTVYCCTLDHNQRNMGHFQPNCSSGTTRRQYDIIEACKNVSLFPP